VERDTRLNDTSIVEYHHLTLRKVVGDIAESIITYLSPVIHKELTLVTLRLWELRNTLIGQRIVIVDYLDVFGRSHKQITNYELPFYKCVGLKRTKSVNQKFSIFNFQFSIK
jgi:hypothetical protein